MKTYKNLIFIVVLSFLIVIGTNPVITYAASSSGGGSFVIILPLAIIASAVLAAIANFITRIKHKYQDK